MFKSVIRPCEVNEGARNFLLQNKTSVQAKCARGRVRPKGRIFAIDSQDQFEVARPLLQEKHELIGKSYSVLLLSLPR